MTTSRVRSVFSKKSPVPEESGDHNVDGHVATPKFLDAINAHTASSVLFTSSVFTISLHILTTNVTLPPERTSLYHYGFMCLMTTLVIS
jgi:hypothetical protein